MKTKNALKFLSVAIAIIALAATLILLNRPIHAQNNAESPNLARFVALMQYIRSTPTPADVDSDQLPTFAFMNAKLSEIYITGFITPFTGETSEQVETRLQSIPEEDRFTAVIVEAYRLAEDPLLLNVIHTLMSQNYVDIFIVDTDLSGADAYLKSAHIQALANAFDSSDYAISPPSATPDPGAPSASAPSGGSADSPNLAKFAALMQYIRSTPTPQDVDSGQLPTFAFMNAKLSEIYITGFITPFTGETAQQVEDRLQSIPEEDRFTAVIVEAYRLAEDPLLLNVIHTLMSQNYVDIFVLDTDLSGADAYLKRAHIQTLADAFDSTNYAIPAPPATPFQPPDTGDPETDRAALVALYNATDGPNWTYNSNWLTAEPLSEWLGVATDDSGRVTELILSDVNLSGAIPPELGNLANLKSLYLDRNQLTGDIPPDLGNLSNLEHLSLSGNQLTGAIPPDLGNPSNLTGLYLSNNDLDNKIPSELGKLAKLEYLSLNNNQLTGKIPSELGNLSNLRSLLLKDNELTGCIPNALGDTQRNDFSELGLSFCAPRASDPSDKAILEAFYNATDGPSWSITTNWLTGKPLGLWYGVATDGDGRITGLSLGGNSLSGGIPTNLDSLSRLEHLNLGGNQLSGSIPPGLGNLANLQYLNLDSNLLTGVVPTQLGNLSNLQWLYLRNNDLSGALPQSLTGITRLRVLRFTNNSGGLCAPTDAAFQAWIQAIPHRSGPDCAVFADRAALTALYNATDGPNWSTSTNWLTDKPLSEWYGVGTDETGSVNWLGLWGNGLNGSIPSQLGDLSNLITLGLENNQLSGMVPSELGDLSNLTYLAVSGNQLSGALPQSLTAITGLEDFYFDHNDGLCAPTDAAFETWLQAIPNWDGLSCGVADDRAALVALYNATDGPNWTYNSNWLTAEPLSEWLGVATDDSGRVTALELRSNRLSGPIPSELGNLSNLQTLNLQDNQLSGAIPSELSNLTNLTSLSVGNNQLTGPIPPELGDMTNLVSLVFNNNQLSGPIPSELGDLTKLVFLYLNNNRLSGPIPAELGNLADLRVLLLRNDQLTGCVPAALRDVQTNDFAKLNLPFCDAPPISTTTADRAALVALYNATDGPNWTNNANWLTDKPLEEWPGVYINAVHGGTIPVDSAGRVSSLELWYNGLTGTIPPQLGNLSGLRELSLGYNHLTGPIPAELGDLANLTFLYLGDNRLSGSIPPQLGSLANLQSLFLNNNQLTGSIPPELGNLANLQSLFLSNNQFTGCIPSALRNVPENDLAQLNLPFCAP